MPFIRPNAEVDLRKEEKLISGWGLVGFSARLLVAGSEERQVKLSYGCDFRFYSWIIGRFFTILSRFLYFSSGLAFFSKR